MIRTALTVLFRIVALLAVLAFSAAGLVTVADIVGRRIGEGIPGVVDIVQLFTLGGAWMAIAYAFWTKAHVRVDLVILSVPERIARGFRLLAFLLSFGLMAIMLPPAIGAFENQLAYGDRSQQLGLPIAWYWLPVLVGLALSITAIALRSLARKDPPRSGDGSHV